MYIQLKIYGFVLAKRNMEQVKYVLLIVEKNNTQSVFYSQYPV